MISSKKEHIYIRDLTDLTLPTIFHGWWASMNAGPRRRIGWKNSSHAPSGRFYLHHRIEVTGSPGIIYTVCDQVLPHPSEHGTSYNRNQFLTKAHIAKLNKLTETEVT
jgi:hypothetical protein